MRRPDGAAGTVLTTPTATPTTTPTVRSPAISVRNMDASLKWRAPYHKMRGTFASQGNRSIALTDSLTGLVRSNRNQLGSVVPGATQPELVSKRIHDLARWRWR